MNTVRLRVWSDRQQVLAIILMAGIPIFLIWFFLLAPLNSRRRRLEVRIEGMQSQLASLNYLVAEDILQRKKLAEHAHNRRMHAEWSSMATRLAAFSNQQDLVKSQVGHIIDFKVALFDVGKRLQRKSDALDIDLPHNLGMEAAVHSDEDARKLMLQLRTVEKLVDMALDLKINELRSIEPLAPVVHKAGPGGRPFLEEYPIRLKFFGSLENLYDLLHGILEPEHVFTMRHLRVETRSPRSPDVLSINTVVSGLLFLKKPDDLYEPPRAKLGRTIPMGH